MMFKILRNAVHIPTEPHIFTFNMLRTRGHNLKLPTRINAYANSFFPDTIELWNKLPIEIVNTINLEQFKSTVYQHY